VLTAGEKYVVFANGVLTSGYAPNPDGRNINFTLFVKTQARETGTGSGVDIFVLHGSTDAPTVDVKAREAGNLVLVDNAAYGDITPYFTVPANNYTLDLYLSDGTTLVGSFIAPLSVLGGNSLAVFASGFLNPSSNQNGAPFGLFAALANGTVVQLSQGVVPVELSSFTATVNGTSVTLNWTTVTETNNRGFEVQRKTSDDGFVTVGFVNGKGTTTQIQNYSFTESNLPLGNYAYRLKQIDFDGTFEFSNLIEVSVVAPREFSLEQNFPNPFNPSTMISFSLKTDADVSLKVFNLLGQEIATLVNGRLTAGIQQVNFNAENLTSGVYFYRIDAKGIDGTNFSSTKKMILSR
ncbi:MAG: T9SS type A sorting domain-containing protein, partial [Ignavibacterium sp.]